MVNRQRRTVAGTLLMSASLLLASFANAAVTASVDRPSVDLNESFLLEIVVDSNVDLEPDLGVLDEQFYRGQVSQLSNTSIINGQIRRSRTWSVMLMAKATGERRIPAISIGNEKSAPLTILVNEPREVPPGEADVFITSEVDQTETYVQAQVLYRIKVYRAVATRQPSLREPTVSGAEALVELAGEERSYEAILNGKAYNVVERVLAVYPQESGEISISPARFEARVLRDGRITGRKVFESDPHTISILPTPPPPPEYPGAVWLPAKDVTVRESWSREPDEINAGEPVTRHVTISALGQMETQIPALEPPTIDGMNVYADKPELSRRVEAEGIRGIRKDQYAMIGVRGATLELPELTVPWWDIEAGEWRVAVLPSRSIVIKAAEDAVVPVSNVDDAGSVDDTGRGEVSDGQNDSAVPIVAEGFWKKATQILAALWLLTLFGWWWSARSEPRSDQRAASHPAPAPVYKQQAKFQKAARKAASAGDKAGVRAAMLGWGRLQWPDDSPRSIGELARRVTPPLADELMRLSAVSYGDKGADWDGTALAAAVRKVDLREDQQTDEFASPLPPLLPPGV